LSETPGVHRGWTELAHGGVPPDLVVTSADSIIFYVHRDRILAASTNGVNGRLSLLLQVTAGPSIGDAHIQPILNLPYSSGVVNLLLLAVYRKPEDGFSSAEIPSFKDLSSTIRALVECGIPLRIFVSESSMLYSMISAYCQHSALDVYTLAACHAPDLHHLAVYASHFLLSLEFSQITDEMAVAMGVIYLRRLYALLSDRSREFKRLLVAPPQLHITVQQCNNNALLEVWRVATAYLVWSASPDVAGSVIENTQRSVIDRIQCPQCKASLERRFGDLKHAWSLVKSTI